MSFQAFDHSSSNVRSDCKENVSMYSDISEYSLMSSANIKHLVWIVKGKSLTKMAKSKGEIILPLGVPEVTPCDKEYLPFTTTLCFLSDKKDKHHFKARPLTPYDQVYK